MSSWGYVGIHSQDTTVNGSLQGFAKVGQWLPNDQRPFGGEQAYQKKYQATPPEVRVRGLHAFAMVDTARHLTTVALQAIYLTPQLVPESAELRAAVDRADNELNTAFDTLGAPRATHISMITLGGYRRQYGLRRLAPRESR